MSVLDFRPERFRQGLLLASSVLGHVETDDLGRRPAAVTPVGGPGLQPETELPREGQFPPLGVAGPPPPNPSRKRESSVWTRSG